jgi:hypothetical protein
MPTRVAIATEVPGTNITLKKDAKLHEAQHYRLDRDQSGS